MLAPLAFALILAACNETEPSSDATVADATVADAPATDAPAADAPAAPAPASAAVQGDVYGEPLTLTESTSISTLLADIERFDGQKVRVEGLVTEVCAKRGCWMSIAGDQPFQELRFKVEDGVITIPLEAKGRYAVAEGTCRKVMLSPEDALAMREHQAEEQGTPVDTTTPLPTFLVKLEGTGAVIRDRI